MTDRLTSLEGLPEDVFRPKYRPSDFAPDLVHLRIGAFHKAHQAVYTDDALAAAAR
jgi:fructuronate reductase